MIKNETAGAMICIVLVAIASIVCAAVWCGGDKDVVTLIYTNAITGISALATGRAWGNSQ